MQKLAHFNKAKQELALANQIDEVKEIRDKAEAYRYIMIQAKEEINKQTRETFTPPIITQDS